MGDEFSAFLSSEEALESFRTRFEDRSWPGAEFRHRQHLAIAVCYIMDCPAPMDALRESIRTYNLSQGGANTEDRGYHETITRFWVEVVRSYMASLPAGLSRFEIATLVVEKFASQRDLFQDYWDFDVLKSREARATWIEPVKPLPEPQSFSPPRPNN
jgi:hypothetical protein